jgi:hypothetical protein
MRDFTEAQIQKFRPNGTAIHAINFCLARLFADKNHHLAHSVVFGLTYEELLNALLLARDVASRGDEG